MEKAQRRRVPTVCRFWAKLKLIRGSALAAIPESPWLRLAKKPRPPRVFTVSRGPLSRGLMSLDLRRLDHPSRLISAAEAALICAFPCHSIVQMLSFQASQCETGFVSMQIASRWLTILYLTF